MRETDLVGAVDENKILALLPMTDEKGANLALRRILDAFDKKHLNVEHIPLSVKFAAVYTIFHPQTTPTLKEFLRTQRKRNQPSGSASEAMADSGRPEQAKPAPRPGYEAAVIGRLKYCYYQQA